MFKLPVSNFSVMTVFELIQDLKSFRKCTDEVVPRKKVGKILEAGRQAPSPGNVQSTEFIVVEDEQRKDFLENASGDKRVEEAPTAIIILADVERMKRRVGEAMTRDAVIAEGAVTAQNMRLVAKEEGIGSVWISGFREDVVVNQFNIPGSKQPIGAVLLGYSKSEIEKDSKFGLNSICFYDEYGNQVGSQFDNLEWDGLRENREVYGKKAGGLKTKIKQKVREFI